MVIAPTVSVKLLSGLTPARIVLLSVIFAYVLAKPAETDKDNKPVHSTGSQYPFRCDRTPEEHNAGLEGATDLLERAGYEVEQGKLVFRHTTAFAANPSSLYGVFEFGVVPIFTLDKADAVIFYGCTPPPMRYFSYTPYVMNTPELNRTLVFASLQDALNTMTIETTQADLRPHSATTVITMTGSVDTDTAVRAAFAKYVEPAAMNTLQVSEQLVRLGSTPLTASGLMLLGRVAIYTGYNETECNLYTNTTFPIVRVKRAPHAAEKMFGLPAVRSRISSRTEDFLEPTLKELAQAVETKITASGYQKVFEGRMEKFPLDPRECISKGTNCLGDCSDAAYFSAGQRFKFGPATSRDIFAVIGVNHRLLESATYTNIALEPGPAVTDDKFGDSAKRYLPTAPAIDKFFAYTVSRSCSGAAYCLEVPVDKVGEDVDVAFAGRVYLNPRTLTGPAYNETLPNYLLHFTPNAE